MPVLAVLAMEIAADTAQRVGEGAGQVMEERFFLDGIDRLGTDLPVGRGIQGAVLVQPDPADPVLCPPGSCSGGCRASISR